MAWAAQVEVLRLVAEGRTNRQIAEMAPRVQWVQSYVTDDKIYCVYVADDADSVLEHASRGGFPADSVAQVRATIDPTTGEPR